MIAKPPLPSDFLIPPSYQWGRERAAVDKLVFGHKAWIEEKLSVPETCWVFHKAIPEEVTSSLLPYGLFKKVSNRDGFYANKQEETVAQDISDVTFAPGSKWLYGVGSRRVVSKITTSVSLSWGNLNSVIGFSIPKIGIKCVFIRNHYDDVPGSECEQVFSYIITSVEDSLKLREYIKDLLNAGQNTDYAVYTYDANNQGETCINCSDGTMQSWDNLVLDPSILRLVYRDSNSFFARKDWFLKNHIPFRRGYLLHGPPGNGKTSVVKAMLSTLGMNAYKIRLFSSKVLDETLETMFRQAQEAGPSMVILEDLDRAFPKTGEHKSPIGIHTLLNCLDGLESQEGVITIATANEPTALDKAILKRPGRFDRVILFDNPDPQLRYDFFIKKALYLEGEDLSSAVDATEGFSFAQLQETYIMAGQCAYERESEQVSIADLHACAAELRGATNSINNCRTEKLGYTGPIIKSSSTWATASTPSPPKAI